MNEQLKDRLPLGGERGGVFAHEAADGERNLRGDDRVRLRATSATPALSALATCTFTALNSAYFEREKESESDECKSRRANGGGGAHRQDGADVGATCGHALSPPIELARRAKAAHHRT